MSKEAVYGFVEKIEHDSELGAIVTQAFATNASFDLVALAGKHGFAFTREEGLEVWEEFQGRGELSDVLLEAVSGGNPSCMNGGGTSTGTREG